MMRFIKEFKGCQSGDIYPTRFAVGDTCPPELEAAAIEAGTVEVVEPVKADTEKESNVTRKPRRSA